MADKQDPLSWAFWNDRKHLLNSRKDQMKLYAKGPDAQNLFKGVQGALDYLDCLPPGQALRAFRGIIPSQSNGGPSLDPLLNIRTMTPNVHGSAKELQRSHATFEVYGRIVLGRWSLDPFPDVPRGDRNLRMDLDSLGFYLSAGTLKSRFKDWEEHLAKFKTDKDRYIGRMIAVWGPAAVWSEVIYSVLSRTEDSLNGVHEGLLGQVATLADNGMRWSYFRDANFPRVEAETRNNVQRLRGGITKKLLEGLIKQFRSGINPELATTDIHTGGSSTEIVPSGSIDGPLRSQQDRSLEHGLLDLPGAIADPVSYEVAEWEPDPDAGISFTLRPHIVLDGKNQGERQLNEEIWMEFFHPVHGFRPQPRYWQSVLGQTSQEGETCFIFLKIGERNEPSGKVWVNRVLAIQPTLHVVSISKLENLFSEIVKPLPIAGSPVEYQIDRISDDNLPLYYVSRKYFFAKKGDQASWRNSTRNKFWRWLVPHIPQGHQNAERHRQWVETSGQRRASPLPQVLESLQRDGKVTRAEMDLIYEHVKHLAEWDLPVERSRYAWGRLPLGTYAQGHTVYRMVRVGSQPVDQATNACRLITVMQGYTALAVRTGDADDVEVIMLGASDSVRIPPGRQVYWIAVTDFILLENIEWVVDGTFAMNRPASFIRESAWHNQLTNYQLELLMRELFVMSQYSTGVDSDAVDRVFATRTTLTTTEEAEGWARITDILRQIRQRCQIRCGKRREAF